MSDTWFLTCCRRSDRSRMNPVTFLWLWLLFHPTDCSTAIFSPDAVMMVFNWEVLELTTALFVARKTFWQLAFDRGGGDNVLEFTAWLGVRNFLWIEEGHLIDALVRIRATVTDSSRYPGNSQIHLNLRWVPPFDFNAQTLFHILILNSILFHRFPVIVFHSPVSYW